MTETTIRRNLNEYLKLKAEADEIASQLSELREKILEYMDERELLGIQISNYRFQVTQSPSTSFDSKSLKKDLPEIYNRYLKARTPVRSIKAQEVKEAIVGIQEIKGGNQ